MSFAWTDERLSLIKGLWTDGLSASQIAAALLLEQGEERPSRSAICGKLFRIGELRNGTAVRGIRGQRRTKPSKHYDQRVATGVYQRRYKKKTAEAAQAPNKRYSEITHRMRKSLAIVAAPATAPKPKPKIAAPLRPESKNLTLFDLRDWSEFTPGTCKYPHGDQPPYKFCGHETVPQRPYCQFHEELCSA